MTRIVDEVKPYRPSGGSNAGSVVEERKGFVIRSRGDVGGVIRHEYECPVHGRFSREVSRASVPETVQCRSGATGCDFVMAVWALPRYPWQWSEACDRDASWCPPLVSIGIPAGEVTG